MDWAGMLRRGLVDLGLRPAEFWALTPAELIIMLRLDQSQPPLTGAWLAELVKAFPDDTGDTNG